VKGHAWHGERGFDNYAFKRKRGKGRMVVKSPGGGEGRRAGGNITIYATRRERYLMGSAPSCSPATHPSKSLSHHSCIITSVVCVGRGPSGVKRKGRDE